MRNPLRTWSLTVQIVKAWILLRLAEMHLQAIIDLINRDIGQPMAHEERRAMLLRRCFAEHAAAVRRAEYLVAVACNKWDGAPAACIRRRARSNAC